MEIINRKLLGKGFIINKKTLIEDYLWKVTVSDNITTIKKSLLYKLTAGNLGSIKYEKRPVYTEALELDKKYDKSFNLEIKNHKYIGLYLYDTQDGKYYYFYKNLQIK